MKTPTKKVIRLSAVLLLSISILYSFTQKNNYNTLKKVYDQDKLELESQLDLMSEDYRSIATKNKKLSKRIIKEMNKIISLKESLRNLEEDYVSLSSYRKNVRNLQKENKSLHLKIDSLKQENTLLKSENIVVKEILTQKNFKTVKLENKNVKLKKVNDELKAKVVLASKVKTSSIKAVAMREKSSGKMIVTTKSKKAKALKVNFKLLANNIATPGTKKVYLQIHDEDNNILSPKDNVLLNNNGTITYSHKVTVMYENKDLEIVSFISLEEASMKKGNYKINVFLDGDYKSSSIISLL